ncbi:MAG TPA: hypothetical protein PLT93_14895, partial [Phycisphaerae bacterium]|nr:hypothetical protein [Phycisphaerae bacterium]
MATSKWFTGETPPDASMGVDGDLYLNTVSSAVYVKKDGSWISVAELRGPAGPAGLEKRYTDYGTTGNRIAYAYTADGKLASRTWARSSSGSHVTTYDYDPDTGDMTQVDYSDATPDVTFTYDRFGRKKTVTDAVGTRTLAYNDDMTLDTEDIDGSSGGLYSKLITHKYQDGSGGTVAGRVAGFQIGSAGDPDADYDVTYTYDAAGRIGRITGPGLPAYGVEYSRLTDSELIEYARYKSDASTTLATIRRTYEANRDLVDYVQNDTSTTVSKYDYVNDALGRRTSVVYTGSAFAQNHIFLWGYNPRSELTTADRHQGTDPGSPGTQYGTNGAFDYAYDPIGNRESYQLDGGT